MFADCTKLIDDHYTETSLVYTGLECLGWQSTRYYSNNNKKDVYKAYAVLHEQTGSKMVCQGGVKTE